MATPFQRDHGKGLMGWWIAHERFLDYSQGPRRMELCKVTEQQVSDQATDGHVFRADCSGFATAVHKWCGLSDPNGLEFNGTGYTGTMLNHLPHYSDPAAANTLALVVFVSPAKPDGHHVALVMSPGENPWLCSHGEQAGPAKVRFSTELAAQKRYHGDGVEAVFLNVSKL